MADELDKRVSELDKQLTKAAKTLEDNVKLEGERNRAIASSTSEQKESFKNLINDLKEVRPETAKIVADFKSAGDDTLKGALLNKKMAVAIEAATIATTEGMDALTEEQSKALSQIFGDTTEKLSEVLGPIAKLTEEIASTEEQIARTKDSIFEFESAIANTEKDIADLALREAEYKKSIIAQEKLMAELDAKMAEEVHDKNKKTHAMQIAAIQDKVNDVITANQLEKANIDSMSANRQELLETQQSQLSIEKNILNNNEITLQENSDKQESLMKQETAIREEMSANLEQAKNDQLSGLTDFSDGLKGLTGFDLIGQLDDAVKMFNNAQKVFSGIAQGFTKGVEFMKGISIEGMTKKFNNVMGTVQKGFNFAKTGLTKMAKRFMVTMSTFFTSMITFLTPIMIAAGGLLMAAAPWILLGLAVVGIVLAGMKLYEESEGFKAAIDTVIGYFIDIKDSIFRIFGGFFDFFKGLFTGDFDLMFSGLKDAFGGIWDLIKSPFKAIGDFFKNVFGIDIMAKLKQMAKAILPGVVYRALFSDDVPEMNEEMKEKGLDAAEESGLYEKKGIGRASVVNPDMIVTAPNNQLNAILADNDIGDETKELIVQELEARKSIIASYNEAKTALDKGQSTLADGSDASLVKEFAQDEMALRRGTQIEQATLDAQPNTGTGTGAGGETVVQQNNNNSSTNIMNSTDTARDENDRYYAALGVS